MPRLVVVDPGHRLAPLFANAAARLHLPVTVLESGMALVMEPELAQGAVLAFAVSMPEFDGFELINWAARTRISAALVVVDDGHPFYARAAIMLSEASPTLWATIMPAGGCGETTAGTLSQAMAMVARLPRDGVPAAAAAG